MGPCCPEPSGGLSPGNWEARPLLLAACGRAWREGRPFPALLTMELRLSGDPEDCVKRLATDGSARRLGDTPELRLGVPADARFLLPRLRLSCP